MKLRNNNVLKDRDTLVASIVKPVQIIQLNDLPTELLIYMSKFFDVKSLLKSTNE